MRNLEVLKLSINLKTGGIDISYCENVSLKVEKHKVSFPHRPKKSLINAIRQLSVHVPFMCELELHNEFKDCVLIEDEKGMLPELFENCQAIGFSIRRKEDTEVKLFGRKKLEFSDKFMELTTPYFIVSDHSEYEYNKELLEAVCEVQTLATQYIDGDYDKTGTQFDMFQGGEVIVSRQKNEEEQTGAILLEEAKIHALEAHETNLLPASSEEKEPEGVFPDNLESFEEEGESDFPEINKDEELPKSKSNKKSSNLKPKKK